MSNTVTLHFKGDATDLRRALVSLGEGFSNFEGGAALSVVALGGLTAAIGAAPMIIGGALAGVPMLFAAIGAAAALHNKAIKKEFKSLRDDVIAQFATMAEPIVNSMHNIIELTRGELSRLAPALSHIFAATAPMMEEVTKGIFALADNAMPGFVRAVDAAGPVIAEMRAGLGRLGDAITYFFTKMAENSDAGARGMKAFFDTVNWLIKGLADLLVWLTNDAVAIHAIHDAVMGVLPVIGQLLYQLEKALGPAFKALVPLVLDIAKTIQAFLVPIFQALSGPMGRVAQALATELHPAFMALQRLFVTLNPLLVHVANTVGDLLVRGIQAVGPLLPPLIDAFGELVKANAGWLPIIVKLAETVLPQFFQILTSVAKALFTALQPAFRAVQDVVAQLMPIIGQVIGQIGTLLVDAIHILMPLLPPLIRFFGDLIAAALQLVPPIARIAEALLPVLATVVTSLMDALRPLLPIIVQIADKLGTLLVGAINILAPLLPPLIDFAGRVVEVLLRWIPPIMDLVQRLLPPLGELLKVVMDGLIQLGDALLPLVDQLMPLLIDFVGQIVDSFVRNLVPVMIELARQLFPALVEIVQALVPLFIQFAKDVLPQLLDVFNLLLPVIADLAKTIFPLLIDVIRGVVVPLIRDVLGPVLKVLAEVILPALARVFSDLLVPLLRDVVIPVIRWLADIFRDYVIPFLRDHVIPFLGDTLGGALRVIGTLINSMIDGLKVGVEQAKKVFKDFVDWMQYLFVDLPKKFFDSGANLMQNFADGINSKVDTARAAGSVAVDAASNPFPGSPAKTGPFSGTGYSFLRGQRMIEDFAAGAQSIDLHGIFQKILTGIGGYFNPTPGGGGGVTAGANIPGVGAIQLKVAPGADSALASLLMNMVRTGQLQLTRA